MNDLALMITIFLLPLVMVICGMSYTKRGPKKITRLQGYRSKMSMKNRDTWDMPGGHREEGETLQDAMKREGGHLRVHFAAQQ